MWLRDQVFILRDGFRRLDRKWHLLIGSQMLFGLMIFRAHNSKHIEHQMIAEEKKPSDSK
jgi:hypothetical protein